MRIKSNFHFNFKVVCDIIILQKNQKTKSKWNRKQIPQITASKPFYLRITAHSQPFHDSRRLAYVFANPTKGG